MREYSFASQQAIAHPEALVAQVKTALAAAVAPEDAGESIPPSTLSADAGAQVDGGGGSSAWAHGSKTHVPDGDPARAARREQARAELERCDREAAIARAEQDLARARLAEARAQIDELGRFVNEQRRRAVDEEIAQRERGAQLMQEMRRLVNEPLPDVPRSREEYQAELDALGRYLDREAQAEQDRLWKETDAALTRRTWDWAFRRSWDARHPGGPDHCTCDGCRAWRREPPR